MPVARAMIGRKRLGHHLPRAKQPVHGPGAFHNLAEPHDRNLWGINDAEDGLDAMIPQAGDRDRRVSQLRAAQAKSSGALRQIPEFFRQFVEALLIGVPRSNRPSTGRFRFSSASHAIALLMSIVSVR